MALKEGIMPNLVGAQTAGLPVARTGASSVKMAIYIRRRMPLRGFRCISAIFLTVVQRTSWQDLA